MMNQGLTTHDEVVSQVASAPWGVFFRPSSEYAPAVSETIRTIARGPSDVLTAKMPKARAFLNDGGPEYAIGFQRCNFQTAVRIFCYLGTWTLALRSKSLACDREYRTSYVDTAVLAELSGFPEGTIRHALGAFCDDKAVSIIRENGRDRFRCDVGFMIT